MKAIIAGLVIGFIIACYCVFCGYKMGVNKGVAKERKAAIEAGAGGYSASREHKERQWEYYPFIELYQYMQSAKMHNPRLEASRQ